MAFTSCNMIALRVTAELGADDGVGAARRLLARGAEPAEFIEELARRCEPELAEVLREEFKELPRTLVETVIHSWLLAESAGKPFTLESRVPDRPLEFARRSRVRFTVDVQDDGVTVSLSHVPGRHADWYRPAARVA